jgi:four helix bundle protein
MAAIKSVEDLACWQEARAYVKRIYELTKGNQFKKDPQLVTQIRGSAVSSMANIAKGFHSNNAKDFMRFLEYSRASVSETISHCYVAYDQHYIDEATLVAVKEKGKIVSQKINSLISYLNEIVKKTGAHRVNK